MKKDVMQTRCAELWLEEDNIVHLKMKRGADLNIHDIEEIQKAQRTLSAGGKHVMCADIINIKSITKEARDFSNKGDIGETMVAIAIIIGSPISRVIGNFFMGLNKLIYPAKLFNNKEKAIIWLKTFFD